jgi:regulatory protein YycH of two-component signal transduction system YycFG
LPLEGATTSLDSLETVRASLANNHNIDFEKISNMIVGYKEDDTITLYFDVIFIWLIIFFIANDHIRYFFKINIMIVRKWRTQETVRASLANNHNIDFEKISNMIVGYKEDDQPDKDYDCSQVTHAQFPNYLMMSLHLLKARLNVEEHVYQWTSYI